MPVNPKAQSAEQPPGAPKLDEASLQKVEDARNFAFHLLKGIKQIGMYRHQESRFPDFLKNAHAALDAYLEKHGPLGLRVEQQNFTLFGQSLFTDDSTMSFKFYRDGVRQLVFRPGLSVEELVAFTLIAVSEPERGAEEISAQLWRAALPNLEYIMVEGFKVEGSAEEDVQVEVDHVVTYLHSRLRTNSDDYLRFARVSTDDLDVKLEGVDQIRGAVITGETADAALKAKLQKEISEEENQRLFPKLMSALFQVMEAGVDDPDLFGELFTQLLDAMLLQEDLGTVNQVVLKLKAMRQKEPSNDKLARLLMTFLGRMAEEQRLARLGDILRSGKPKHPQEVVRYLSCLDASALPTILSVLETVENPENRQLINEAILPFASEHPEPFVNRLQSERPQTVRDMVFVLDKINHPDRLRLFARVLTTPNLALRLDVMSIIAKGRTGEARNLLATCLLDPHPQARILAAKLLCNFSLEHASNDLLRTANDPAFAKKAPDERSAFYAAMATTGQPAALAFLESVLHTKPTLFNKQRVLEEKLLVVEGLKSACTIQTYKQLSELSEEKDQPHELLVAVRQAMHESKKALFGEKEGA